MIPCRHPPEAGWKAALGLESGVAWKAAIGAAKVGRWLASIPQPAPPRSAYVSFVPAVKLLEKLLLRSVPASNPIQWDDGNTGDQSARTSAHGMCAREQYGAHLQTIPPHQLTVSRHCHSCHASVKPMLTHKQVQVFCLGFCVVDSVIHNCNGDSSRSCRRRCGQCRAAGSTTEPVGTSDSASQTTGGLATMLPQPYAVSRSHEHSQDSNAVIASDSFFTTRGCSANAVTDAGQTFGSKFPQTRLDESPCLT